MPHVQEAAARFAHHANAARLPAPEPAASAAERRFTGISILQLLLHLRAQLREARLQGFVAERFAFRLRAR